MGHFQCCFDRGRPVVGVEDVGKIARGAFDERLRQASTWLMGQPGKDHVGHLFRLARQRTIEARVIVAVNIYPP